MKIKVLLAEDDEDLGHLLRQFLELNNFAVHLATDGSQAFAALQEQRFDIAVIDVMMPGEDGFTLAKKVSQAFPGLPFIFLTARKLPADILKGLELGADDYIAKPFNVQELLLRIRNILRRATPQPAVLPEIIYIGTLTFEPHLLQLATPAGPIFLTEKETQLLLYLYAHRDSLIRRSQLLAALWPTPDFFSGRSLDVFMTRLRKYLSADPSVSIESIRGLGFRFKCGPAMAG